MSRQHPGVFFIPLVGETERRAHLRLGLRLHVLIFVTAVVLHQAHDGVSLEKQLRSPALVCSMFVMMSGLSRFNSFHGRR